jgi:thiol-disulfide isomerase/thioredoxin
MQITALAAILSLAGGAQAAGLKVGDPAPSLQISQWLNGKPVNLAEGKGKNTYVVEFWATWCGPCRTSIPHLTKMANRFSKHNVTFIGVSIDDEKTLDRVEPFVKKMGKKMGYPVAIDDGSKTNEAWLEAAGVQGIPHAFIVSKEGKIAWHGHPMQGMDVELAELVGDKEYAENRKKAVALQEKAGKAVAEMKWDEVLTAIDGLIALDPDEIEPLMNKYYILAVKKKDRAAAEKLGPTLLEKTNDSEALNELSWTILTDEGFEGARDTKLALSMAKKANELSEGKDWSILDTYARALFENGDAKEAAEFQKKAVDVASKDKEVEKEQLASLKEALEKYEKGGDGKKAEKEPEEKKN